MLTTLLSKFVSDNGCGMLLFFKYKFKEKEKHLIKVDKFYASSQICSVFGYINKTIKNLSVREWDYPLCGT